MPAPPTRPDPTLVTLVVLALVAASIFGAAYYLAGPRTHAAVVPSVSANLTTPGSNVSVIGRLPPGFFGIDLREEYPPAIAPGAPVNALNGTPVAFYRWPGGDIAESFDVLNDTIYAPDGAPSPAITSLSAFASWCLSIGCKAILQLPTEIDNASYAAAEVNYTEDVLGLHPAYFEFGNEPADWTHFGIPWADWNASQNISPTPTEYAAVVHAYIAAINRSATGARFLGIGGVGEGAYSEPTWLGTLARVDGPNLSGVALHVYPAGNGSAGRNLTDFFATLNGSAAIVNRMPADRSAIDLNLTAAGDPAAIATFAIFADEVGSGTTGSPYAAFESGYPEVPYVATEILQALGRNLTGFALFAYESGYPGSYLNASTGTPRPIASLYTTFLPLLPTRFLAYNLTPAIPGVRVVAADDVGGADFTLFVVSTDNASLTLNWTTPFVLPVQMDVASWDPQAAAPTVRNETIPPTDYVTIPPYGMWMGRVAPGTTVRADRPDPAHPVPRSAAPSLGRLENAYAGPFTVTRVSVPLMPGMRRTRWRTMSRASLTCPAWIFTMRSNGPVTASTSTTWGICRTRRRTSSRRPISVSTSR